MRGESLEVELDNRLSSNSENEIELENLMVSISPEVNFELEEESYG